MQTLNTAKDRCDIVYLDYGQYKLGSVWIPGHGYFLPTSQIAITFQSRQDHISRDLKAIAGKGCTLAKVYTSESRASQTCIALDCFADLLELYAGRGNEVAKEIRYLNNKVGLMERATFAHGHRYTEIERQAVILNRAIGVGKRKGLGDSIKSYVQRSDGTEKELSENGKKFIYKNVTDAIYRAVFCATAKQMREELGLPKKATPRDYMNSEALAYLSKMEETMSMMLDLEHDLATVEKMILDVERNRPCMNWRKVTES